MVQRLHLLHCIQWHRRHGTHSMAWHIVWVFKPLKIVYARVNTLSTIFLILLFQIFNKGERSRPSNAWSGPVQSTTFHCYTLYSPTALSGGCTHNPGCTHQPMCTPHTLRGSTGWWLHSSARLQSAPISPTGSTLVSTSPPATD